MHSSLYNPASLSVFIARLSLRSPSALYLCSTACLRRPHWPVRLGSMPGTRLLFDQPHESSDLKPSARASPRSEREPCRRLAAFSCVQSIARVGAFVVSRAVSTVSSFRFVSFRFRRKRARALSITLAGPRASVALLRSVVQSERKICLARNFAPVSSLLYTRGNDGRR